jgi:hypothetical protein
LTSGQRAPNDDIGGADLVSCRWQRPRPVYLPPDPGSRTSYVAGEIAQCDFWLPDIAARPQPGR